MIFTTPLQKSGKNRIKTVYGLCGLAAGLGIWQITAVLIAQPLIVPKLEAIASATVAILADEKFFSTVAATLLRIAATIGIDTLIAFILGIAAGISYRIEAALSPFETAMRAVPTMGVLLLSLIWFNSEITPIFVASLIALPLLYRGVVNGVKNIDDRLIQMSAGFRVPFLRRLKQLYIPSIRPFTLTAYSAALGLLVKVMVTAEALSQPRKGIGTEFQIARAQLDTATIFGWAIIVIIFAGLIEQGTKKILSLSNHHKPVHFDAECSRETASIEPAAQINTAEDLNLTDTAASGKQAPKIHIENKLYLRPFRERKNNTAFFNRRFSTSPKREDTDFTSRCKNRVCLSRYAACSASYCRREYPLRFTAGLRCGKSAAHCTTVSAFLWSARF